MTSEGESAALVSLGHSIQTQLPGIKNEIEEAISTLKKLRRITDGTNPVEPPEHFTPNTSESPTIDRPLDGDNDDVTSGATGQAGVHVLEAGESFGRYQIARVLGHGGMGAVYLAYDSQLHRYVALKTPFLGGNPQAVQRFYREARASAQLRSPFICPIHDVGQIGGILFITMAFIDGKSLGQVMAGELRRDHKAIAEIIKKTAQGLQKAHDQGIIHRDLKPDNIMIDGDGDPIVMDFGLARHVDEQSQVTVAGTLLGTPAYMSPEQVEGIAQNIGPLSDIYSLGVILYQMLAGRLPFLGSLTSMLCKIVSEEPTRPSAVNPEIGEDSHLERVCLKMMAKKPAERFQSMADIAAALEGPAPQATSKVAKPSAFKRLASWFKSFARSRTPGERPGPLKNSGSKKANSGSIKADSKIGKALGALSSGSLRLRSQIVNSGGATEQLVVRDPDLGKQAVAMDSSTQTIELTDPTRE